MTHQGNTKKQILEKIENRFGPRFDYTAFEVSEIIDLIFCEVIKE